jgi:hypothetical protein
MARHHQAGGGQGSVQDTVGVWVRIAENSHLFEAFTGKPGLLQIHYTYMT